MSCSSQESGHSIAVEVRAGAFARDSVADRASQTDAEDRMIATETFDPVARGGRSQGGGWQGGGWQADDPNLICGASGTGAEFSRGTNAEANLKRDLAYPVLGSLSGDWPAC